MVAEDKKPITQLGLGCGGPIYEVWVTCGGQGAGALNPPFTPGVGILAEQQQCQWGWLRFVQ